MKKLVTLAIALMLSGLLTTATLAAQGTTPTTPQPEQNQTVGQNQGVDIKGKTESEGSLLQKAYFKKREDAKARRDAALELRQQNISRGNPGDTGM